MKVLVFGYRFKEADRQYIQQVFDKLAQEGVITYIYNTYLKEVEEKLSLSKDICVISSYEEIKGSQINCVLTLGGDGTILRAVTEIRDCGVPILGINLGRLGFLASIEKKLISDAIDMLLKGTYSVEERKMVYVESNIAIFGETRFGLNDFTLHKSDTSSMMVIHVYINDDFLNSYWADGIIVSTPTGSTGYSLSCGGPIVFPESGNFVITPVAAHNLNVRPIVISDNSVISFEIEGRAENFLCTLDHRFETVTAAHKISVRKCDFTTRLVILNDITFLKTIHNKLHWGSDVRN